MRRPRRWPLLSAVAIVACASICCQQSRETATPTSDDPAARRSDTPDSPTHTNPPPTTNAARPSGSRPADNAAGSSTSAAGGPPPDDAALPDYIRILELDDSKRRAEILAELPESGIINLKTTNVRRLKLVRGSLPFAVDGSVAVRIDGQGIEWQRKYDALELVQLRNGSWEIVRSPDKP